jgi:hypothetical protein
MCGTIAPSLGTIVLSAKAGACQMTPRRRAEDRMLGKLIDVSRH